MMNPQIRFGEDLMSRVSYSMMNPGGEAEMTAAVRAAMDALLGRAVRRGQGRPDATSWSWCSSATRSCTTCCSASTRSSWAARRSRSRPTARSICWASDLDLHAVNPGCRVYVLPCIAGHVGADCAGVVLSETPWLNDEIMLVVDVGTNAEIVLGNKDQLLACSSPTGPAFEGAQIGNGQRAAPGAIERVRIDRETLEPRFKVIGCDLWSDDPGFAEATRKTGVTGICGSGIIEALAEMYLAGHHHPGRRGRRRHGRAQPAHPRQRAAPSATSCTRASPRSSSRRTTSAPSSSPRPRSMPAPGC